MANRIDVHFHSGTMDKDLRAAVTVTDQVKAVLIFPLPDGTTAETFAGPRGLTLKSGMAAMPLDTRIFAKKNESEVGFDNGDGPGVCYWIGSDLICW